MALLKANTGIGTTNPTSALHVIGDGLVTGVVTAIAFNGNINAGIGTIVTLTNTRLTSGVATITTLDNRTATILDLDNLRMLSGIATITEIDATTITSVNTDLQYLNANRGNIDVGIITDLSGTRLNYTGVGTITTLNSTNSTITNLTNTNLTNTRLTSGIGTVTRLDNTHFTSGVSTITILDNTTATITDLANTRLTSGIATITTLTSTTLNNTTANITDLLNTRLTSGIATITDLTNTSLTNTRLTSGIATVTDLIGTNATLTRLDSTHINAGIVTATQFSTGSVGSAINITSDSITGPSSIVIDPAGVGDNSGAVRIKGDLYVDGTQFVVNSTTIELADFNVGIATTVGTNLLLDGAGIGIGSTNIRKTFTYDYSSDSLKSSENFDLNSGKVYKINETEVLSNNTLGSGVIYSSLQYLGTLNNLNVSGLSTLPTLVGTYATITELTNTRLVSGIATINTLTNTDLNNTRLTSGIGTITTLTNTTLNNTDLINTRLTSGISTITDLTNTRLTSGIATVTDLTVTNSTFVNLNSTNLNVVTGIVTDISGTRLNYTGVGTITTLNSSVGTINNLTSNFNSIGIATITDLINTRFVSGISTITTLSGTTATFTNVNSTNSDFTNLNADRANIDVGIVTDISGTRLNYTGVGTIATLDTTNGTIDYLTNTDLNVSGIATIQNLSVLGDFEVYDSTATFYNNVFIGGNLSIGGTTTAITVADLKVIDKEIILGVTTNAFDQDVSNDFTASHGGIAIASTEGYPLVDLSLTGFSSLPPTYKQLMWIAANSYGVGTTDAWMFNYAVGVGSTQIPNDVRLAVGNVQITDKQIGADTLEVLRLTSGIATITGADISNLRSNNFFSQSGIITDLSGSRLNYTGFGTITNLYSNDAYIEDISSNVGFVTDLTAERLNITGVSTFTGLLDANGGAEIDNIRVGVADNNTIDTSIGNLTLDSNGGTIIINDQLSVSGITTFQSNVYFGDNDKLIFGDGSDLEIYHSGTTSFIVDNGTGNLTLGSNGDGVSIVKGIGSETIAIFNIDGSVELYYDNSKKFETSGIGATVYGTLDAEQLNITGVVTATTFNGQINSGVGTITTLNSINATLTNINSSGISTLGNTSTQQLTASDINVSGVVTATRFYGEIVTTGVGASITATDIFADNLVVSGITTLNRTDSSTLNVIGVGTIATLDSSIGTITTFNSTNATLTNINSSGISTFGTVSSLFVSGITTLASSGGITTTGGDFYVGGSIYIANNASINSGGIITAGRFSTGAIGSAINITSDSITGPSSIVIDPAAVGDDTGAVRIKGDLYVDGTQFVVNSTTIDFADFNVGIATTVGTNLLLDGAGIGIGSTNIRKTFTYDYTNDALKSSENFNLPSGKTYKINGTDVLSSTTLGSGVVNSSLTSVGTLGQLNVSGVSTFQNSVTHPDNVFAFFGNSDDLYIGHNGSISAIADAGTGDLYIAGDNSLIITDLSYSENKAKFNTNGSVELYYDNSIKFETTGYGVTVFGTLQSQQLNVSGISTIAGVQFTPTGIVTSSNPGVSTVVYYGDGSNLIGVNAFNVISQPLTSTTVYPTFATNAGVASIGISSTQVAYIPSSNRLGIGTTNPNYTLEIVGDTRVSGLTSVTNLDIYGTVGAGNSVGNDGQYLKSTGVGVTWASFPTIRTTGITTATQGQTVFNFAYNVGFLDVYVNGVKLTDSEFTAVNGGNVILQSQAFLGDIVEFVSYNTVSTGSGSGGFGPISLDSLTDVVITNPQEGESLGFDGTYWINDYTFTTTTATSSQVPIHTLSSNDYRSVEYMIQVTNGTNYHLTKILVLHNGTIAYNTEYGTISTGPALATFDTDILGGAIRLLVTPYSSSTMTYKIKFTAIKA